MSGWTLFWVAGTWVLLFLATLIYIRVYGKREEEP